MTLAAQLVRMMAAVIALIAVQFMPPPAQAHSGHVHAVHAHAHHGVATHSHAAADARSHHVHAAQPAEMRSADLDPAGASAIGNGCTTGCCGFGVSCCGCTALAVAADQPPPLARSSSIGLERDAATRGLDPDALRKPPRSLI